MNDISLDNISIVAGAGASIIFGLIVWWAYGRFQPRLQRALCSVAAVIVSFVVYFLLGILLAMARPERAHETAVAIVHGVKTFGLMLIVVQALIASFRKTAVRETRTSVKSN